MLDRLRRRQDLLEFRGKLLHVWRHGYSPISTRPTAFTRLLAITGMPSWVTAMLRTISPPPGIAQLWNFSLCGSKRTIVFGLAFDSLYPHGRNAQARAGRVAR